MVNESAATAWPPEWRWLAGLVWADGCLAKGERIYLGLVDEQTVSAVATLLGRPYGTTLGKRRANGGRYASIHQLTFADSEIMPVLLRSGFGPKPTRPWPTELASGAFLRGLFDGDGSVLWHRCRGGQVFHLRTRLAGQMPVLRGCRAWLADQGFRANKIMERTYSPGSGLIAWSHYDSLRLAKLMYSEPGPCMVRKRVVFEQVMP